VATVHGKRCWVVVDITARLALQSRAVQWLRTNGYRENGGASQRALQASGGWPASDARRTLEVA
jgi:hypothetical protein